MSQVKAEQQQPPATTGTTLIVFVGLGIAFLLFMAFLNVVKSGNLLNETNLLFGYGSYEQAHQHVMPFRHGQDTIEQNANRLRTASRPSPRCLLPRHKISWVFGVSRFRLSVV